jgi:cell wall-associated NlpC family hydrolase
METTPRSSRRLSRSRQVLVAAATAVALLTVAPAAGGPVAAAAPRHSHPADVAEAAASALQAFDNWQHTGEPFRYIEYLNARDRAANTAAAQLELDPAELRMAWSTTAGPKQVAVLAALTQLGVPYRSRSSIEGQGFDCSGLTAFAFGRAGVTLVRQSRSQINAAAPVTHEEAMAGDLVFYPGHVMMYLGVDRAIVDSPNTGNHVRMTFVSDRRSLRYGDPLG